METRVRYAEIRPYTVPATLAELAGPTGGVVVLPTALDWTPKKSYDLADDVDLRMLYETVIREAMHIEDLRTFLNARLLAEAWPRLWLPLRVRGAWESRFPDLAKAAA
ncbi:hypothetical protein [Streptomyces cuspidosporus]|uniref:hypothetical protein n=1 Tax=Streptomyces cuspidosporus TaxID=66882 RepID=UPI0031FD2740